MARVYADEDFDQPIVDQLRLLGYDVLTAQQAGQAGQGISDAGVLAFAIGQWRTVLTYNRRDFIRIHGQVRQHRGIVVCTRDKDVAALARRIHLALVNCPNLDDQLIRIVRPHLP